MVRKQEEDDKKRKNVNKPRKTLETYENAGKPGRIPNSAKPKRATLEEIQASDPSYLADGYDIVAQMVEKKNKKE